jgi:hypothetical protein
VPPNANRLQLLHRARRDPQRVKQGSARSRLLTLASVGAFLLLVRACIAGSRTGSRVTLMCGPK